MRFNDPAHLAAWRERGRFPAIHDAIANVAIAHMRGDRLLDLGCSFGLLGGRIFRQLGGSRGIGVDADGGAVAAGRSAGVPLTFVELKVTAATLPQLLQVTRDHAVDTLIARRILPELFGEDLPTGRKFADGMAAAGVREVFLEGRVSSSTAVNALRGVAEEVALLAPAFREVKRFGAVSYLVAA